MYTYNIICLSNVTIIQQILPKHSYTETIQFPRETHLTSNMNGMEKKNGIHKRNHKVASLISRQFEIIKTTTSTGIIWYTLSQLCATITIYHCMAKQTA